jgi:hypothetical protein
MMPRSIRSLARPLTERCKVDWPWRDRGLSSPQVWSRVCGPAERASRVEERETIEDFREIKRKCAAPEKALTENERWGDHSWSSM